LFDEARHPRRARFVWFGWLDVTEAGIRPRWSYTYCHQTMSLLRHLLRLEQHLAKFGVVADRPVGVNGDHDRVRAIAVLDRERRPCQRGGGASWLRFGDDVLARNWRQ